MALSMPQFLAEIEFAVTHALTAVWEDHSEAHRLFHQLERLRTATDAGYHRADAIGLNAEDPDDVAMSAGAYWETYFGVDKDRHASQAEFDEVDARFAIRQFSVEATAGAVLQHAKQGISIVHGGLNNSPAGRQVTSSLRLADVIWQARNQAIHWEDGNLHPPVLACFETLASAADPRFMTEIYKGSQAFRILQQLKWRTWESFRDDLLTLQ